MTYSFTDHIHNFAVWTAARAVQRNFTSTKNIRTAIESTSLKELIDMNEEISESQFDLFHRQTAKKIISSLASLKVKASYGQVAKIIAIYIKTGVIIRNLGRGAISKVAHPPIDRILLKNLNKEYKMYEFKDLRWTQLNEDKYFTLIQELRKLDFEYFWKIEEYWNPVQNE